MKSMRGRIPSVILGAALAALPARGFAASTGTVAMAELSLPQMLRMAEDASPDLKAALDRERAAADNIRIFQSFYYPTFDVEAIESFGFPGSSRDLGISGLMGSPYRSGPAAGVSADLELYDPARGFAVETARRELDAVRARTLIVTYQVDQLALEIYLDASRFRGLSDSYRAIAAESGRVEKEVNHFVATGQRSVVERLLVHDQTADADMTSASFDARYRVALQRLAVVTASTATALSCPSPDSVSTADLGLRQNGYQSPLLLEAAAQAAVARSAVSQASAANYPRLLATASVGDMDTARLVSKRDYSGGFGVQLPLFEGYRIQSTVEQARALASARDQDQLAVRMDVDQLNAHYDESIEAARVQLQYLDSEETLAQRAFHLAKQRYYSFQGTLVDVREALRNVERIEDEQINVQTDLLLAQGSKALLNGARLSR
ncbi:MAG TPA: TolC family protein [Elusimicrobiota bacterium]|nr:TolC family protein [Elusimicrobiota bacterium]